MLTLVTPPVSLPVTVQEAKDFCRVTHDDEDAGIAAMIGAATAALDGPEGLLGRALMTQTWRLTLDRFPPMISVPMPPCQAVTSISYLDATGIEWVLSPDAYEVTGLGGHIAAKIRPLRGTSWPRARYGDGAVQVEFVAGWSVVPERLRQAILAHVSSMYDGRECQAGMTAGYDDLVRSYRLWSF
ncbi:MAG TPA: phage head-tail connector protein [Geminicoccus sp.]|jgi:uncharacterized phiE125 gp8 family phage protein|uniref:head-tail connector protein n=1 Tax=Geminicoccus sp. TaxID=2024832 RepID=UPI002E2EC86C|nr:phage head-tail connector protein [Geminicoccus sp.]HEX2529820.1 phage head-tail connector protein [Geminicoccus sp.]